MGDKQLVHENVLINFVLKSKQKKNQSILAQFVEKYLRNEFIKKVKQSIVVENVLAKVKL